MAPLRAGQASACIAAGLSSLRQPAERNSGRTPFPPLLPSGFVSAPCSRCSGPAGPAGLARGGRLGRRAPRQERRSARARREALWGGCRSRRGPAPENQVRHGRLVGHRPRALWRWFLLGEGLGTGTCLTPQVPHAMLSAPAWAPPQALTKLLSLVVLSSVSIRLLLYACWAEVLQIFLNTRRC